MLDELQGDWKLKKPPAAKTSTFSKFQIIFSMWKSVVLFLSLMFIINSPIGTGEVNKVLNEFIPFARVVKKRDIWSDVYSVLIKCLRHQDL